MNDSTEYTFDLEREVPYIAQICELPQRKVSAAAELLAEGNTIPFIARYRKERTGGLDEIALRKIEAAVSYSRELADRKQTILKSIGEQDRLDDALRDQIINCRDKKELEELYLPFKPKRRTRATIARERGLGPLAEILNSQVNPQSPRDELLRGFVNPELDVPDGEAALAGACDILAEDWAQNIEVRRLVHRAMQQGMLASQVKRQMRDTSTKFEMYYDYREPVAKVPSHRFLAMRRGEVEDVLKIGIEPVHESVLQQLTSKLVTNPEFIFRNELKETVADCYRRLLFPSVESALLAEMKEAADSEAVTVFSRNLRDLLLAPPAGQRVVMGIDPGYRTGCKVAVIDATGRFVANATVFPTPPVNDTEAATQTLLELIDRWNVELIAIGNGTASRETDSFAGRMLQSGNRPIVKVMVNEAGASIYSASETAAAEFPDLDVTVRGAISIARRLQDPLAELVKIDPKSIGVGQYQHDVHQAQLSKALVQEVESCVNLVGVDLNTASAALLSYVSGIGPKLATAICQHRDANGPFSSREQLLSVPRLGRKAFQQSAGFLRVRGGPQPLDNSAVHPESYYLIDKMSAELKTTPDALIGNKTMIRSLDANRFVDEKAGLPTIQDILAELEKPGRDPREQFRVPEFADGVQKLADLREEMVLEGQVTNVTRFGAFVDIGVHQDGLIHISELDNRFVNDPSDVLSVGEIVRVKVLSVDIERKRIALSRKQVLE